MNQQDELAQDIRAVDGNHSLGAAELAEWLTERGWFRPRVVETIDELQALPGGTVIRDALASVGELGTTARGGAYVFWAGNECEDELADITLPATVLWVPEGAE